MLSLSAPPGSDRALLLEDCLSSFLVPHLGLIDESSLMIGCVVVIERRPPVGSRGPLAGRGARGAPP